jgi:2',3'-cyclic-nucleotide 2'-phosphodiesterase (5'-nucleotidase family)
VTDEEGMFLRVEGERRVKNVRVNGEPIDPEKTYILAGRDFMLTQYGGGFTMFKGAKVLQDAVKVDTQVMSDYINESLGGTVGAEYEDPYGQGRITIIEKPE